MKKNFCMVALVLAVCLFSSAAWAGQTITIDGTSGAGSGTVGHDVFGNGTPPDGAAPAVWGTTRPSEAINYSVIVNSGGTVNGYVYGGSSYIPFGGTGSATATGNIVNINGGTVKDYVLGGDASVAGSGPATASDNCVTINSGTVEGGINGGGAYPGGSNSATASGNSITINGGTIGLTASYITAGDARSSDGSATANDNTVTISGSPVFIGDVNINGGIAEIAPSSTGTSTSTGNTLHIKNYTGTDTISSLEFFQIYNFTLNEESKTLKVNAFSPVDLDEVTSIGVSGAGLEVGDKFTLIDNVSITGPLPNTTANGGGYTFALSVDGGKLIAEVTDYAPEEEKKETSTSGGGGCNAGLGLFALAFIPFVVRKKK